MIPSQISTPIVVRRASKTDTINLTTHKTLQVRILPRARIEATFSDWVPVMVCRFASGYCQSGPKLLVSI